MAFREWADTEAADQLVLPIRGKHYTIPALGHLDAIALREDFERAQGGELPQIKNEQFLRMALGPALDQMRADNLPAKAIAHAATVAHTDAEHGRVEAEKLWEKGPDPEALAALIEKAAKLLADSTTSPTTPPPARTSSTKKPASTASTRSPRAKTPAPRGRRSSTSRG